MAVETTFGDAEPLGKNFHPHRRFPAPLECLAAFTQTKLSSRAGSPAGLFRVFAIAIVLVPQYRVTTIRITIFFAKRARLPGHFICRVCIVISLRHTAPEIVNEAAGGGEMFCGSILRRYFESQTI